MNPNLASYGTRTIAHADTLRRCLASGDALHTASRIAIDAYQHEVILACLAVLQRKAIEKQGLDYLQVFDGESIGKSENLWYIEDGEGGAITALLPSNY